MSHLIAASSAHSATMIDGGADLNSIAARAARVVRGAIDGESETGAIDAEFEFVGDFVGRMRQHRAAAGAIRTGRRSGILRDVTMALAVFSISTGLGMCFLSGPSAAQHQAATAARVILADAPAAR